MNRVETPEDNLEVRVEPLKSFISRRSFLGTSLAVGVGAIGGGLLATAPTASAKDKDKGKDKGGRLTEGDAAILRFLAAAEIIETDAWQQYNELAGIQDSEVPGGSGNPAYTEAVKVLDEDMDQYIDDNTDDEISHFTFINAYLKSKRAETVNLDQFRTLPSSTATGAQQIGRLTNLTQLTIDTSFWTRYRSDSQNPDFGDVLPQAVPGLAPGNPAKGQFPAIPRTDADLAPPDHLQAIANTAGFHFAWIEQGGTSLYASLAQRVENKEVLRILLSIGGSEIMHFQTWQDKAGNAPPLTDPTNGLVFPDLNADGELTQTNLIMPEPTIFLDRKKFPICSIIRPTETDGAATRALNGFIANGLFIGQPPKFFALLRELAQAADAAGRGGSDEDAGMEATAATATAATATAATATAFAGRPVAGTQRNFPRCVPVHSKSYGTRSIQEKQMMQANKVQKGVQGGNSFSCVLRDIFGERSGQPLQEALPFRSSQCLAHVRGAPHFQSRRQPSARRHSPFPHQLPQRHLARIAPGQLSPGPSFQPGDFVFLRPAAPPRLDSYFCTLTPSSLLGVKRDKPLD